MKDNWDLLFEALESFALLSSPSCRWVVLAMPDKLVRRPRDEAVTGAGQPVLRSREDQAESVQGVKGGYD
jgi:hypothetical protein